MYCLSPRLHGRWEGGARASSVALCKGRRGVNRGCAGPPCACRHQEGRRVGLLAHASTAVLSLDCAHVLSPGSVHSCAEIKKVDECGCGK